MTQSAGPASSLSVLFFYAIIRYNNKDNNSKQEEKSWPLYIHPNVLLKQKGI